MQCPVLVTAGYSYFPWAQRGDGMEFLPERQTVTIGKGLPTGSVAFREPPTALTWQGGIPGNKDLVSLSTCFPISCAYSPLTEPNWKPEGRASVDAAPCRSAFPGAEQGWWGREQTRTPNESDDGTFIPSSSFLVLGCSALSGVSH